MITLSSTEAKQNFGAFLDQGSREIVVVKRQNRQMGAFIPMKDLELLRKVKAERFFDAANQTAKSVNKRGLSPEKLNTILKEENPS